MYCQLTSLALLLSGILPQLMGFAQAAPGAAAIADGRATCGNEYNTAKDPFTIPLIDKGDYWKISRIATCESPVFWTKFDTDRNKRMVYLGAMVPKARRFRGKYQFHALLYGPGVGEDELNGFRSVPNKLPEGIAVDQELVDTTGVGVAYLTRNSKLDACDYITADTALEKNYQKDMNDRCTEIVDYPVDYDNRVEQNATGVENYVVYAFEHSAPQAGTYHLQTWLTLSNDAKTTAQGKYEVRIAPRVWVGDSLPDEAAISEAHTQKTACSCGVYGVDFKEQNLDRLGNVPKEFLMAELPVGKCSAAENPPNTTCEAIVKAPALSDPSALSWAAVYNLEKDREYEWTFYPTYQGTNKNKLGYPHPGMYFYMRSWYGFEPIVNRVNQIFSKSVEEQGYTPKIIAPDVLNFFFSQRKTQYVNFTDPSVAASTSIKFRNGLEEPLTIFTEYDPHMFLAHALRDILTGEYIFPADQTSYKAKGMPKAPSAITVTPKNAGGRLRRTQEN